MNNIPINCNISVTSFLCGTINKATLVIIYEAYCDANGISKGYSPYDRPETKEKIAMQSFRNLVNFVQNEYRLMLVKRNQ